MITLSALSVKCPTAIQRHLGGTCHSAMEGGFRTSNDSAYSCFPHGSAENKSLRLTSLLPKMIGKIKARHLVVGEAMEKPYFVLTKGQIFSPLQSKRKGSRRKKRSRLPPPWCLGKHKAGSSTGYRCSRGSVSALLILGVLVLAPASAVLFWHRDQAESSQMWHTLELSPCVHVRGRRLS